MQACSPEMPGVCEIPLLLSLVRVQFPTLRPIPASFFLKSLLKANVAPPIRPNTTPSPGFIPFGAFPTAIGGSIHLVRDEWAAALESYPDPAFPLLLLRIFSNGAELGVTGLCRPFVVKEYRSGPKELDFLRQEVSRRLSAGEIHPVPPSYPLAVCPLAAVPKELTKFRAIHDLRPINSFVPREYGTLRYSSLDELYARLRLSPGFLWKTDLSNAFRHIRLSAQAQRLARFTLDGTFYTDLCLPFGSRVSPFIFNLLAEALHWILQKAGIPFVLHYLDDFFGVCDTAAAAAWVMDVFFKLTSCLGIKVNKAKCEGPASCLIILGIEIDGHKLTARIDDQRKHRNETRYTSSPPPWYSFSHGTGACHWRACFCMSGNTPRSRFPKANLERSPLFGDRQFASTHPQISSCRSCLVARAVTIVERHPYPQPAPCLFPSRLD